MSQEEIREKEKAWVHISTRQKSSQSPPTCSEQGVRWVMSRKCHDKILHASGPQRTSTPDNDQRVTCSAFWCAAGAPSPAPQAPLPATGAAGAAGRCLVHMATHKIKKCMPVICSVRFTAYSYRYTAARGCACVRMWCSLTRLTHPNVASLGWRARKPLHHPSCFQPQRKRQCQKCNKVQACRAPRGAPPGPASRRAHTGRTHTCHTHAQPHAR